MSTHPNAILMAVLTPDDLARKTMRAILESPQYDGEEIKIGHHEYRPLVMEDNWDDGFQIAADEGSLVFWKFVTYGYGEVVDWADLEKQKVELEQWCKETCDIHHCSYVIRVTANYW